MNTTAWLRRKVGAFLLGPEALKAMRQHPEGMVQQVRFGNVVLKVWLNRSWRGNPYFKFTLEQVVTHKSGGRTYRKTFYRDDLEDICRCVVRVQTWMTDGDGHEQKRKRR
ncbi:MAG: hypothetical protein AAF662_04355 [Pseudomonadota bacterium]